MTELHACAQVQTVVSTDVGSDGQAGAISWNGSLKLARGILPFIHNGVIYI